MAQLYVTFSFNSRGALMVREGTCHLDAIPGGSRDPMLSLAEVRMIAEAMFREACRIYPDASNLVVTNWMWLRPDEGEAEPLVRAPVVNPDEASVP